MKRTRLSNPMSFIVLGNKKTPVGSKISVIGYSFLLPTATPLPMMT